MTRGYRPSINRLQQDFANRLNPNYRDPSEITRAFDAKFESLDPETTSVADDIARSSEIEEAMVAYLPTCEEHEGLELLKRSTSPRIAKAALQNPSPEVRELAMNHLREFAAAGDPFSLAILEGREIP
jgi:hypothetical protein